MKDAIVFSSQTGNTRMLADQLRTLVPEPVYFGAPSPEALKADRIYVGFWTNQGTCDSDTAEFLKTLTDQEVFLFGTAGFGGAPGYYEKILDRVKALLPQGVRVLGTYLCQGKMPMSVRDRYVKMQESGSPVPNLQGMIENFDRTLSHPDQQDLDGLRDAVNRVI